MRTRQRGFGPPLTSSTCALLRNVLKRQPTNARRPARLARWVAEGTLDGSAQAPANALTATVRWAVKDKGDRGRSQV